MLPTTLLLTTSLALTVQASSWVYWTCQVTANPCPQCKTLAAAAATQQKSYWVQYSEANAGGLINKHALAQDQNLQDMEAETRECPTNGLTQGFASGNNDFYVKFVYADGGAENKVPCPLGDLYQPDGTTLLGHNDGSAVSPGDNDGHGFCMDTRQDCACQAHVTVNSP